MLAAWFLTIMSDRFPWHGADYTSEITRGSRKTGFGSVARHRRRDGSQVFLAVYIEYLGALKLRVQGVKGK
jgi:hypothetical protein